MGDAGNSYGCKRRSHHSSATDHGASFMLPGASPAGAHPVADIPIRTLRSIERQSREWRHALAAPGHFHGAHPRR